METSIENKGINATKVIRYIVCILLAILSLFHPDHQLYADIRCYQDGNQTHTGYTSY